jgi:hypothetical protein
LHDSLQGRSERRRLNGVTQHRVCARRRIQSSRTR